MSVVKTSPSPHFPASISPSKVSLPKHIPTPQHHSQLPKQSPHFPLNPQKYLLCNRTLSPSTEATRTGEKQGVLRSYHRPGYSVPVSPTNISAYSLRIPSLIVTTQHSSCFQGHKHNPVLFPATSPTSPSLYAITKYMRTRTDLPSGLAGWRHRSGDRVIPTGTKNLRKNKLIDEFLRRFEKKK